MMSSSLVLGANGQDGSYLCELLATSGHRVIAVGRQVDYAWPAPDGEFRYVQIDLCDRLALKSLLVAERPEHIYHVAAIHGASGFRYEGVVGELFAVGVLAVHVCLEYLREHGKGRLFYASSAKAFGNSPQGTVSERTVKRADCLYSTSKIAAGNLIDCYRRDHGIQAIVTYLFNHESPRRQDEYFVPKIARALANGLAGRGAPVRVNSLDFFADWGDARQYMEMSIRAMERGLDGDYIVATGQTLWAAAAVRDLFDSQSLDYRRWLQVPAVRGTPESVPFIADATAFTSAVGITPRLCFPQLVVEMARSIRHQ